jgi:CHAT domain-containing protein
MVRVYELPRRGHIDAAVEAMRRSLERRPGATAPSRAAGALRDVARLVLEPIAEGLAGRRLIVIPDGSLHYVPFAALTGSGGEPLLARFEVVNAPSASVVAMNRLRLRDRPAPSRMIAVLADPVYDGRDQRVGARHARSAAGVPASLERATRGFGFGDGLPRLPFTRREGREIMAAAARERSRLFLDFGASLETVRDPELATYRYLHFAAHGLLNDELPELSGIVLSLVDPQGADHLGLLTAPEVMDLRLGADLVVLSACRSALGREVRGEGILGLAGAFMYAGSPRVIASLWPVDDLATAELMKRLYRALLGPERLAPAAALRRAQQELRALPHWREPYYWAGFQIQGEWR